MDINEDQKFKDALARTAKKMGCTVEVLKKSIEDNVNKIVLTPSCLSFGELLLWPELPTDRKEHVSKCRICQIMIKPF